MRQLVAVVFAIVALVIATGIMPAFGAGGARIGIFNDPQFPGTGACSSAGYLTKLLSGAGYQVTSLRAADLADEKMLDISKLDLLVLPQGETYPANARNALFRYLKQGGDFISMGGYAFDRLCYKDDAGKWRFRDELYGKLEFDPGIKPVQLFDFGRSLDNWKPNTGTAELPTIGRAKGHNGGAAIEIHVADYQNWHGFASAINKDISKGCNYTSFWAKGDAHTPQMSVEWQEKDGSRWIAVVELTPQWKKYDLPPDAFKHWYDNTNRRDEVHPDNAKSISFGMAYTHTKRLMDGPHTVWVDDVRVFKAVPKDPGDDRINSRFIMPKNPDMIGVFDPSHPLKWVSKCAVNPSQLFMTGVPKLAGDFKGYAANGLFGDTFRWVPLINGMDRYGRERGDLGALTINYAGERKGSVWAFFGVNNQDLFSPNNRQMGKALVSLVGAMTRGLFLNRTGSDYASYRVGEGAKINASVSNYGRSQRNVTARLQIIAPDGKELGSYRIELAIAPGEDKEISLTWKVPASAPDFCRVRSTLLMNGKPVDTEDYAFTVWSDRVMKSGPKLTFNRGRFELDGAPRMLFGSNEAGFWKGLPSDSPLDWDREIRCMADDGLRVIRIHTQPQFFWPKKDERNEAQFRKLDAWVQLCRKYGISPYIDVMDWAEAIPFLGGKDYLWDTAVFPNQHEYVLFFSSRYKDAAGILFDEDNEIMDNTRPTPPKMEQWNAWLTAKYGTSEALEKVWGKYLRGEKLGAVSYDPGDDAWDSRRSFDWRYFHRTGLRDGWVGNFANAVKEGNPNAIRSVSGLNIGAMDGFTITEPLHLCDNHFYHSLYQIPGILKESDMRLLNIAAAFGEFGSTMNPTGYDGDYSWPEKDQVMQFLMIDHYLVGCGAALGCNWDYRDQLNSSFPWGVRYAGDLVEKDVMLAHRQAIRFFNRMPLEPELPKVLVCVPDNNRLGGRGGDAVAALSKCIQVLVDNKVDFTLIREYKLDKIPAGTKAILFPVPYCISDDEFEQLKSFAELGGALYFSGDICYNSERAYLGDARLRKLAGVRITKSPESEDIWTPRSIESAGAKMIEPGLAMNSLGNGFVFYSAAPIEIGQYSGKSMAETWRVYSQFLKEAGIQPNPAAPAGSTLHCFRQPLTGGGSLYVLFNKDATKTGQKVLLITRAGKLEMWLGSIKPGVVALDASGSITALEAQGNITLNGKPLVDASGHFMLTTLDGEDVRKSRQIMILPIGPGKIAIHTTSSWKSPIVRTGEEKDGCWRSLEVFSPVKSSGALAVSWDEVRAQGILLLTERDQALTADKRAVEPLHVISGR